jgi:type I restriction enzyme S subunit
VSRDRASALTSGLPSGWLCLPAAEVGEIRLGRQRSPENRSSQFPTKYLRAANITEAGLDLSDILQMEFKPDERERYRLDPGDIILAEASGSASQVGKPALWSGELPLCCFQNTVIRLRPRTADSRYLLWLFTHFLRNGVFAKVAGGVGINHLGAAKFSQLLLPIAPQDEQRRIVAEIEKQFTRLDAGVAALQRVQAKLKRYRAAVLKAACEGRLVPTEAKLARKEERSYEAGEQLLARILTERREAWTGRAKYKEPTVPDTVNLPTLPEGWARATVEQLSTHVQYGSSAKTNEDSIGVPVLRMGNIEEGKLVLDSLKYLPANHEEFPDLLLAEGDLLFNRTNSAELVGKTAVFRGIPQTCSFASYLIRVRLTELCLPDFVAYFINSVFGRAWIALVVSQQVGQANVNGTKLQALVVPCAPFAEQKRIVVEVERRLSVVEEVEAVVAANLRRATRLRQSILERAFSGRLVSGNSASHPGVDDGIKGDDDPRTSRAKGRGHRAEGRGHKEVSPESR